MSDFETRDSASATDEPTTKTLAALVYSPGEDVNRIVADFADELGRAGRRIGGIIQVSAAANDCDCRDSFVLDVETGVQKSILQDLGRHSQSCRLDSAALAEAGAIVANALAKGPELLFINRFGKLEAEGKGVFAEIGAAAVAGVPTLICVSTRYLAPWRQFTMGLDAEIPCSAEALRQWWRDISAMTVL
jgi:hypothetical protein